MRSALIISLLLALAAAIFAIQNPGFTELNLGPWQVSASTALVIIVTFVAGVLVGILASLPSRVRSRKRVRSLEKSIADEKTTPHQAEPQAEYVPESERRSTEP